MVVIPRRRRVPEMKIAQALNESQLLVLGFSIIILVGTVLLMLPISASPGTRLTLVEALFTATSAVTVTGLAVFPAATGLSLFGQIVLLLLIQVGGVGFIAFAVIIFIALGRRVSMRERMMLRQTLGVSHAQGIVRLTLYVFGVVLLIEFVGAVILFLRWWQVLGVPRAAYFAIFHAVSAFCNAGFDLWTGTSYAPVFGFTTDPISLVTMGVLIMIGALGMPVIDDLITWTRERRLSIHTRLTLMVALVLTVIGTLGLGVDDRLHSVVLPGEGLWERWLVAWFTTVSARTAGITIIPLEQMNQTSHLLLMISMFVGGAPASMGGGVTTSVIGVLAVIVISTVRGDAQAVAFDRAVPLETVFKAVAVMTVSTLLTSISTWLLLALGSGSLSAIGFEVMSAFSNTGYSLGVTPSLSTGARLIICFVMFWGRLGPLTLVVMLAQRQRPSLVTHPEERILIG